MTMRRHCLLAIFVIASTAAAGCVGSGAAQNSAPSQSNVAAPAEFGSETGAIEGSVRTTDLQPISGAQVTLDGGTSVALAATDGTFSFSNLPPGNHVLVAEHPGFALAQKNVDVQAGRATTGVTLALVTQAVAESYAQTYLFRGFVTCSIGYALVLSEECGQGLQTPVGTYGTDPNNHIDWKFNLTTATNLKSVYLELSWRAASAAAQQLAFNVAHGFTCTPDCSATTGPTYCDAFSNFGHAPQVCEIPYEKIGFKDEPKLPWDITGRAWAAPSPATEAPNIVLQQSFTMYRTEFYGLPKPDKFSAIGDG